jgi:hypothetical protein
MPTWKSRWVRKRIGASKLRTLASTPASDVFSLGNIAIREFPLIGELPAIPLRTDFSRTVIPPEETHEAALGSAQAISVNEWESVEAGKRDSTCTGSSVIETRLVKTAKQNFGSCQAIPNSALSV